MILQGFLNKFRSFDKSGSVLISVFEFQQRLNETTQTKIFLTIASTVCFFKQTSKKFLIYVIIKFCSTFSHSNQNTLTIFLIIKFYSAFSHANLNIKFLLLILLNFVLNYFNLNKNLLESSKRLLRYTQPRSAQFKSSN